MKIPQNDTWQVKETVLKLT